MPSKLFAINAAWLACALMAIDLVAWTQTILLHDDPALAKAEPKTLRYRLLHVAGRLTRGPTTSPTQDRKDMALGRRAGLRVPPPARAPDPADLTWRPYPTKITDNPGTELGRSATS